MNGRPATPSDLARAEAFFAAWDLQVRPTCYPDYTSMPMGEKQADAVQALAQAFADERESAEDCAAQLTERLEASNARLRETIGIASDIAKLMPQVEAALDHFAGAEPRACAAPYDSRGNRAIFAGEAHSYCALPRGHRGPHGVSR